MAVRGWREWLVASVVLAALGACSGKVSSGSGAPGARASGEGATNSQSPGQVPVGPGHVSIPPGGAPSASTGGVAVMVAGQASSEGGVGGTASDNASGAPESAGAGGATDEPLIAVTAYGRPIVHESFGTLQLRVVLSVQPSANVEVHFASSDPAHAAVDPLLLIFTPEDWSKSQQVIVVGVRDNVADGGNNVTIQTLPVVSADLRYAGIDLADFDVFVIDESDPGIAVWPAQGGTTESGGVTTFSIGLNSQPTATVTIPLSSSDPSEGSVAQDAVIFEPSNWSTPQQVTVTGVDDQLADGAQAYDIITGPAVSTDPSYAGLDPSDVHITNADNE